MQNALHLVPKPPKKDFIKLMKNDVKVLRYASRFDESVPGAEEDRRFVIYFHLADDTIHIHEPPKTNSGILGGKFLQRGKYKKDITSYFVEEDFFAGYVKNIGLQSFSSF